jgi:hypothetical protein
MVWKVADNIRETTLSTGSPITLAGVEPGYEDFASFLADGERTDITIKDATHFETGEWQFDATNNQLTRVTFDSSDTGNPISWGAGAKQVVCTPLAKRFTKLFDTAGNAKAVSRAGDTMTGALTLSADPASALHAATKQYVDGLAANLGKRARVRVATTVNITISTALNNGDSLDGVTLATDDLVLVKNQSTAAQNGVYVVGAVPARAAEFDTYNEHPGSLISVAEGTQSDTLWLCTSNAGGTLDTTAIAFSQMVIAGELLAANNLSDLGNQATAFNNIKQAASTSATGVSELATDAEAQAKSDAARTLTPSNLAALGTSDTFAGLIEVAVQSEMETGTDMVRAVVPGRQQFHPSAAKCWGKVTMSGGTPTLVASYNITSVTDTGVGLLDWVIATDFSSANWAAVVTQAVTQIDAAIYGTGSQGAGSVLAICIDVTAGGYRDPAGHFLAGFGDQ